MSIYLGAPVRYRHWSGKLKRHPEADYLEQAWGIKPYVHEYETTADVWIHIGFAPAPKNRWQRFWMHIHHGCLMRYPLASVLAFAVRNSVKKFPKVKQDAS